MVFPEAGLWDELNQSRDRMTPPQRKLWDAVKIPPALWQLQGYEPCWVVGLIGATVLYHNHLESGFNRSPWTQFGVIDQYQSLDWDLETLLEHQLAVIAAGGDSGPWSGEPQAGEFVPSSRKPVP